MSIQSVMPSNYRIFCRPLLLLPSIFPSIRVFSDESVLPIMWPKYWSFSFSNSPSNEYSGLISFRMDWFDLLVVQGTLRSFLQHYSLKASILWHSAFFMVQLLPSALRQQCQDSHRGAVEAGKIQESSGHSLSHWLGDPQHLSVEEGHLSNEKAPIDSMSMAGSDTSRAASPVDLVDLLTHISTALLAHKLHAQN